MKENCVPYKIQPLLEISNQVKKKMGFQPIGVRGSDKLTGTRLFWFHCFNNCSLGHNASKSELSQPHI